MLAAEPGWWLQVLSPCWCRPGGGWTLTEQQGGPPRTAPHTPAHHGLELVISVLTSALSSGLQRWQGCCDTTGVEYAGWETARHPNTRPGSVSGLSGATFRYSPVTSPVVWIVDMKFGGARPQPFVPGYPGSWVLVEVQTRVREDFTITITIY